MRGILIIILTTIFPGFWYTIQAQNIKIILGPDNIAMNQAFTITVEVENDRIRTIENFPEIPGFNRVGQSTSSSTNIINGQYSTTQSITQNYVPMQEGTFTIAPFRISVNEKTVSSPGKTVTVGPAIQQQRRYDPFSYDPFEEFFGRREPQEFMEVQEDAFLSLSIDKDDVYVGEGFTVTLGLYVSVSNRADLEWPNDLSEQLAEIKKSVTPANCWEENFRITSLNPESVEINKKRYRLYKLFQSTFYPLNTQPISFPATKFNMIKYKVAKNQTFFGRSKQADAIEFKTKARTVKVKDLPPHPLKDRVPVGKYLLSEEISSERLQTGQSFTYEFTVQGEGNISAIDMPEVAKSRDFDFYPPNVRQNINRSNNRVRGSKSFNYYGIPNEPGEYDLGDYIWLVYFDPYVSKYDTLKSNFKVVAEGESKKNVSISSNDLGSFYNLIDIENNKLESFRHIDLTKLLANIAIVTMMGFTFFLIFKK